MYDIRKAPAMTPLGSFGMLQNISPFLLYLTSYNALPTHLPPNFHCPTLLLTFAIYDDMLFNGKVIRNRYIYLCSVIFSTN